MIPHYLIPNVTRLRVILRGKRWMELVEQGWVTRTISDDGVWADMLFCPKR